MATIAEEISALRGRISAAYDVIDQKGGDVPFDRTSWNLSASIDSIRTGDADPASIVPVRYLKSTGTQYIDTGRYFTSTNNGNENHAEVEYQIDELDEGLIQRIIGTRNSQNNAWYQIGPNGTTAFYTTWGAGNPPTWTPDTLRHRQVMDTRSNQIWLDGALSSYTYSSTGTLWASTYLFARNNGSNTPELFARGRIYRYRHLQNENIMRDLIPARIGTEGVMYDVNTGEILHNQGTGDFEYGLDVIPVLRDAVQVMFLQFSGTQGFDTGIYGNQDTRVDLIFQRVGSAPTATQFVFGARTIGASTDANTVNIFNTPTAWNIDFGKDQKCLTAAYSSYIYTDPSHCRAAAEQRSLTGQRIGVTAIDRTDATASFTTPTTMRIGLKPTTGYADTIDNFIGRFWGGQIWEGTTLVRDFVPCRIGTTGYLYDRVSQTLFSNIGTGDFTLGPDVG